MPCPLHALPAQLQEDAMLRIHQFRLARADTEERGVELLHVVDDATRRHVAGFVALHCTYAGVKIIRAEEGDGIPAFAQVFPERFHVLRTGETPGHGNDGNRIMFRGRNRIGAQQACHARVVHAGSRLHQCGSQRGGRWILENPGHRQCPGSRWDSGFTLAP